MRTEQKIRMAFQMLPEYPGKAGDPSVSLDDGQACDVALARDLLNDVIGCGIDGDFHSAIEQEDYEANLVNEARLIAEGKSEKHPNNEHLRILLKWLDGSHPDSDDKTF